MSQQLMWTFFKDLLTSDNLEKYNQYAKRVKDPLISRNIYWDVFDNNVLEIRTIYQREDSWEWWR